MDDLIAFLRARLDEDERWALAASTVQDESIPGGVHWQWAEGGDFTPITDLADREWIDGYLVSVEERPFRNIPCDGPQIAIGRGGTVEEVEQAVAAHIARHDPARVLAEVDAKRRIIDECERDIEAAELWENYKDDLPSRVVLRLLALPYVDHPDYRESWRP